MSEKSQENAVEAVDENQLVAERRRKLSELRVSSAEKVSLHFQINFVEMLLPKNAMPCMRIVTN